jgi:cysteine synthase
MPDDQSEEKRRLLTSLGAKVRVVPACAISNRDHYVNTAKRLAEEIGGIFVDQFENLANFEAHYKTTGPEIWNQTAGQVDAFVMSAGTGGTLAGVSQFLKEKKGNLVRIVLADPQGSSLLRKVTHGVCFTPEQSERRIRKHRYDSIAEGVGLDRITANFDRAKIDTAVTIGDQELVLMAHWLLQNEGLFVGSSSALNIAAACQVARDLGPGHTIVTVVCEGGVRGASRFWNKEYLASRGLVWPVSGSVPAVMLGVAAGSGGRRGEGELDVEEDEARDEGKEWEKKISQVQQRQDQLEDVDDGLDDFAEYAVTVEPPSPPPPPPQPSSVPAPAPAPAPTTSSTPKKPALIRPAGPKTPARVAAAAAVAQATPLQTTAISSTTAFDDENDVGMATPNSEAARVAAMKAAMLAQKEKQRIKRGLPP